MKKSASITLTLMASMALVACGRTRRCVDAAGVTVPEALCSGAAVPPGYHWIYVARSTAFFHGGSGAHGSATSDGVSRGGIGSTGASHASGSSGGHGAGE